MSIKNIKISELEYSDIEERIFYDGEKGNCIKFNSLKELNIARRKEGAVIDKLIDSYVPELLKVKRELEKSIKYLRDSVKYLPELQIENVFYPQMALLQAIESFLSEFNIGGN